MAYSIKVCGMKYPDNIKAIEACGIDYIGFIFYEKSKRYVGETLNSEIVKGLNPTIKKVGVFVNHSTKFIEEKVKKYQFDYIQLHGEETVEQCVELKSRGHSIIKVFQVDDRFDFKTIEPFKPYSDYFLFDTKSDGFGGTGRKFNWKIFKKYDNEKPIFLSGGLDVDSIEEIKKLGHLNIHALDLNSKFELDFGRKDENLIKEFIKKLD